MLRGVAREKVKLCISLKVGGAKVKMKILSGLFLEVSSIRFGFGFLFWFLVSFCFFNNLI